MTEHKDILVNRARGGDREAFALLYDDLAPLIRAVCWDCTRDHHAAIELTQEVFLRAFENLGRLREPEHCSAWLLGIARRSCSEWRRGRERDRRLAHGGMWDSASEPTPQDTMDAVRIAIAQLPEPERMAVHAFYLHEMRAHEAAQVLGVSRSGLYIILASARARLKQTLTDLEITP